jgi:LysR family transcriptional regulator for bpeEF and oprC
VDRLRAIEVFVRVVEAGSFTAAARSLGIPKASATAAVQQLEAELGVRLLHRTTRRVGLTPDGAVYCEEAGRLVRELGELERGLGRASAAVRGRVRVDVPSAAGRHVIAPALPALLARYPELTVEIGSTDRPVDLIGEGVDCAIRGGELYDDALVAKSLGALPVITCAAPAYLARHGVPGSPAELDGHLFIGFFSARTGRHFDVDFTRGDERTALRPRHRVSTNDSNTWFALALAGCGLLQVPCSTLVRRHLERGELVRVLAGWRCDELPLFAVYPRARVQPARVRAVVDWFAELYAEECASAEAFVGAD